MLKNHKLELKLVKDTKSTNAAPSNELSADQYVAIAEQAITRIGKRVIIGACVLIAVNVLATVLTEAGINALDTH